jgi:hypothetical protein
MGAALPTSHNCAGGSGGGGGDNGGGDNGGGDNSGANTIHISITSDD